MRFTTILSVLALAALTAPATAQQNMIPGTDVELGLLDVGSDFSSQGHIGGALTGQSGFSMSTTSCNPGSVNVPWQAPMQENHPYIAFMVVREDPGSARLLQISDRSYLKHGFFALSNNQCGYGCSQNSGGTFLAIGCSDTYGIGNNSQRSDLGPPEEIDPWLGTWSAFGSFFDCPTGTGCNGGRSYFGSSPDSTYHRVVVQDSDLNVPGATFAYYGYYVIRAEPEANRENNGNSRNFVPTWNGSSWNTSEGGSNPHVQGTILQRWGGANITSGKNTVGGVDRDGRVYIGSKVTANGGGSFHYEYAIHNRDNNGGISEIRIPLGTGVNVSAVGFHDVDQDAGNQWGGVVVGNELVFTTSTNPLYWNCVYNVWFDCDAAPVNDDIVLGQFSPNPNAAASFLVSNVAPSDGAGPMTFTNLCNGDGGNGAGCTDCPCGNNMTPGTIGGCRNSALQSARLDGSGTPSVSGDTMRFELSGAPPTSFCILTSGDSVAPGGMANPCFGFNTGVQSMSFDGLRCAIGNTLRHGGRSADGNGDIGVTNNGWGGVSGPPIGLIAQGGFTAGQTRHYQVINRDSPLSSCMRGLNTSQAVSVTFEP